MKDIQGVFDKLSRLGRFKPKRIRYCECNVCTKSQLKCMKYHFVFKCQVCGGKVPAEFWSVKNELNSRRS